MSEFDAIRPYYDHEVQDVLTRIVASRELSQAANQLIMPSWLGQGLSLIHISEPTRR